MKRKSKSAFLLFLLLISIILRLGHCGDNHSFTGKINSDGINVRSDSSALSEILCVLDKEEPVLVYQEAYHWYKIKLPQKTPAYVKQDFFNCLEHQYNQCTRAKAKSDNINVRLKSNVSSAIIGKISKGETVYIKSSENGWFKIPPPEKAFGWVHKQFVDKAPDKINRL